MSILNCPIIHAPSIDDSIILHNQIYKLKKTIFLIYKSTDLMEL